MDLSVIIPSYKDLFLHKTIKSILDNFVSKYEIVVVIDGYQLQTPVVDDPRVRVIHHEQNLGMREAINSAVRIATGEFLMRTDEHCMFCPEFDRLMLDHARDDEIISARRYFLDPKSWQRMPRRPVDYERLVVGTRRQGVRKFEAKDWYSRTLERADVMVDENMAWQGSMWIMSHRWWDEVVQQLQTAGYGPLYQDSIEMLFKTWRAGGRLVLNKHAWYAHKHRSFRRTHHYPERWAAAEWQYALDLWMPDYLKQLKRWGMDIPHHLKEYVEIQNGL